jgi:hypothetical protein
MWLETPVEIEQALWDGALEPDIDEHSGEGRAIRGFEGNVREAIRAMPVVSIGQPETWPILDLYPRAKLTRALRSKLTTHDYYLVRFSCSFRQVSRETRIEWARFRASLLTDAPNLQLLAEDLYPHRVTQEVKHQVKVTLGPTLKFLEVEASGVAADFGLEYRELQPIISAAGIGETELSWDYRQAKGVEVLGSKWMHALIKAPKGLAKAQALLDLMADVEAQGVRLPVFLPRKKTEETHLLVTLWS